MTRRKVRRESETLQIIWIMKLLYIYIYIDKTGLEDLIEFQKTEFTMIGKVRRFAEVCKSRSDVNTLVVVIVVVVVVVVVVSTSVRPVRLLRVWLSEGSTQANS